MDHSCPHSSPPRCVVLVSAPEEERGRGRRPAYSRSQLETWQRSASLARVEIWTLEPVRYARRRLALGGGHVWQLSGVLGKWSAGGKALAVLHVASGRGQSEVNGQLGELSRS